MQLQQLHQAVCSVPIRQGTGKEQGVWFCDEPRDYPGPHLIIDPSNPSKCPLTFNSLFGNIIKPRVYTGHFISDSQEALAIYEAGCEGGASNEGGSALFGFVDDQFKLVAYYPGEVFEDCVVPTTKTGSRQIPYCYSSAVAQGEFDQSFGPVSLNPTADSAESWLSAGNMDGAVGSVSADCKNTSKQIHEITDLKLVQSTNDIVVEGKYLDPISVQKACTRYRNNNFNNEEKQIRDDSLVAKDYALLRKDEVKYYRVIARFDLPNKVPHMEYTQTVVP